MQESPLWNFLRRKPRRIDMTISTTSLVHPQPESVLHAPSLACFLAATLVTFSVLSGWKSSPTSTEHGSNFSSHQSNRLPRTHLPTRFDRTIIVHSGSGNERNKHEIQRDFFWSSDHLILSLRREERANGLYTWEEALRSR